MRVGLARAGPPRSLARAAALGKTQTFLSSSRFDAFLIHKCRCSLAARRRSGTDSTAGGGRHPSGSAADGIFHRSAAMAAVAALPSCGCFGVRLAEVLA